MIPSPALTAAEGPLTEIERRVLDAIDLDGLISCLCDLIAIPSVGGEETPAQEYMAREMEAAGMNVDLWELDLDALGRDPACTAEIERVNALGVVGGSGAGKGPTLVLNGHVDVVPAGDPGLWSVRPWQGTVRDGRVYGRGSVDMKGGLASALFAVRALRDAGVTAAGRVLIQSVVGEEDGGIGTLGAIRRGHTGDGAIVLEPTELVVAPAQAGAYNFRVTVAGRPAHGALRAEGVNPIEKFIPIYCAIQALEARRNDRPRHPAFAGANLPYAICVGRVESGIWSSTVPESLVFEGRLGVAVGETPEAATRELEDAIAEASQGDAWLREHPPTVEWHGARFRPAAIAHDHPLTTVLSGAYGSVCGQPPPVRGMPYGADMHLLVNEGKTPTVLFGPGDVRRAHAPDEFVPIDDLATVTQTLALTIMRFCGVEGRPAPGAGIALSP